MKALVHEYINKLYTESLNMDFEEYVQSIEADIEALIESDYIPLTEGE